MAENVLAWLSGLLSPAEAEAKVVGSPEAMALLRDLMAAGQAAPREYLPELYRSVIERAEAVPETVSVREAPGLNEVYGTVGEFDPLTREILYEPGRGRDEAAQPVVHELLHFLNSLLGQPYTTAEQHEAMQTLLGSDRYRAAESLRGYRPQTVSPAHQRMLLEWLGRAGTGPARKEEGRAREK